MLDSVSLGTSVDGSYVKYILTTCFEWDLILVSMKTPKRRSLHICEKTLAWSQNSERKQLNAATIALLILCVTVEG